MKQLEKFSPQEDVKYKRIFGGVAMPSEKAAGFAVVFGETRETGFEGKPKHVFLAEAEGWDGKELIERVGWLDYSYRPERWLGDTRDVALDKYVRELNKELTLSDATKGKRPIKITLSGLLLGKVQDRPFTIIVPDLNRLLGGSDRNPDKQRLFLKAGSKLMTYMKAPQLGDAASMTFDDFPAITSLAFVVLELERPTNRSQPQQYVDSEYERV